MGPTRALGRSCRQRGERSHSHAHTGVQVTPLAVRAQDKHLPRDRSQGKSPGERTAIIPEPWGAELWLWTAGSVRVVVLAGGVGGTAPLRVPGHGAAGGSARTC